MMLRRLMTSAFTILVILYCVLIVAALFSDRLIFQPQHSSYTDATLRASLPNAQIVKLHSGHDTISALYLPNPDARFTLLFSHGNAEDLGDNVPFFQMLHRAGYSVFAYDYRGYGTSTGRPTERGVYQDVEAAYQYLTRELHIPPSRIIAHGRSVGCGAAIHLASLSLPHPYAAGDRVGMPTTDSPVAALIVESPFISAFRVLTRVPLLPFDKFNNLRLISRIHVPVLVIHGRADNIVPFSHGQRIFDAANPPKQNFWVDRAGHNDLLFVAGPRYFEALHSFTTSLPK